MIIFFYFSSDFNLQGLIFFLVKFQGEFIFSSDFNLQGLIFFLVKFQGE